MSGVVSRLVDPLNTAMHAAARVRFLGRLACALLAASLVGCPNSGNSAGDWSEHTQGLPFIFGYEKGLAAAKEQKKPIMFFVTTTWCSWCKKLAEENFNEPEIRALLSNYVCVIVDGDSEPQAVKKLGAEGFPHIVFASPDGEQLVDCRGYVTADLFKPLVEKALEQSQAK